MHKALKLKRVADALAAAGGGWLPLTLKAWRKYVKRKRGKENKPPALPPPPPVEALHTQKLQPPSPPLSQVYEAPPVPPPRRRPLRGALRDEAVQLAALLERRRAASATYLLEQHQSSKTRRRLTSRPKPMQSKRFGWLKTQGARSPADKTAHQALKVFPALRCLEVASGVASNLFDRFATAVLVVEFYLTDDLPRVMEPPVAVDP
jgi:type IV secretory pathway VirB10-like protein